MGLSPNPYKGIHKNQNLAPEATSAVNKGTPTGGATASQTPQPATNPLTAGYTATSVQQGGAQVPAANDTVGSKLVESLQAAKSTQMNETANRLADQGISGGQAASQLQQANRDYQYALSQGLGQFNMDRLNFAANTNRALLQLELQRELGLGNLSLGSQQLAQQAALALTQMEGQMSTEERDRMWQLFYTAFMQEGDNELGSY